MLSFREMRKKSHPTGFDCHHLIPIAVIERRSLAITFGKLRSVGFEPQDFATNGMHLPNKEVVAIAFDLPLHRGPHRHYNEMVAERIAQLDRLPARAMLFQVHALQCALRQGLRGRRKQWMLGKRDPMRPDADFRRLDLEVELLWGMTAID
jgi:A nuclease family of the HNH/ENDO VII superfamily with conserved AHH